MKNTLTILLATLSFTIAGNAHAWTASYCNGSSVKWRGTLNVTRNRCSIPDTGPINAAYWNGVNVWNNLATRNLVDNFYVTSSSDCSYEFGDGVNEVFTAQPVTVNYIAGKLAAGVTMVQAGLCFIGANDIDEADIFVANNYTFSNSSFGEEVFIHEFGHLFGFDHVPQSVPSIMGTASNTADNGLNYVAQSGRLSISTFPHWSLWPTDVQGLHALYGASDFRPNAKIATWMNKAALDPGFSVSVCQGATVSTKFYLGNAGATAMSKVPFRIRLVAEDAPYKGTSYQASTGVWFNSPAYSGNIVDWSFTVPDLPLGWYFLYYDLDYPNTNNEWDETDNTGASYREININCLNPNPPPVQPIIPSYNECSYMRYYNMDCCQFYGLTCSKPVCPPYTVCQ